METCRKTNEVLCIVLSAVHTTASPVVVDSAGAAEAASASVHRAEIEAGAGARPACTAAAGQGAAREPAAALQAATPDMLYSAQSRAAAAAAEVAPGYTEVGFAVAGCAGAAVVADIVA